MSGAPPPGPAPDALELAALLCSRVCHDLISPVGAIVNGLEVLDDNPKPEDREFALDLIRKSAKTASSTAVFLAISPRVRGVTGKYYGASGVARRSSAASYDEDVQDRMWTVTESLIATALR